MKKAWFEQWFDSSYYHLLYSGHDESDAQLAIDNLFSAIQPPHDATVLDLACGKGRHSKYLADKGFDVTGIDISAQSIAFARQYEHQRLNFYQHDMRLPFRSNYYDVVVNFFTSFGYFNSDADHLRTLRQIAKGLKPGGIFLLDFFNAIRVRQQLIRSDQKTVGGITFNMKRSIRKGYVYKHIRFETSGQSFHFREKVRLFTLSDLKLMFESSGLVLQAVYGDYQLAPFDTALSPRLILIARKTT